MKNPDHIAIKKENGPIVFLGGMNAMPMMYAIELKKRGYDVIYFVDRPKEDQLSRPENHFREICYPYPSWVVEMDLKTQILLPLFGKMYAKKIEKIIKNITQKTPQLFFLNGFFCALASCLDVRSPKIVLSHGSDLDSWADTENIDRLAAAYKNKSIFKFLPAPISRWLINFIVFKQFNGMMACNKVIYFPKGFNVYGDRVVDKLKNNGVIYLERYDVSFEPLKLEPRNFKERSGSLKIFSGVRFVFETFTENNEGYSKGNNKIIQGLAKFYENNKDIEVHFVEKGTDVAKAKALCKELGLDKVVVWHKEMSFLELLKLYELADICFDQVGEHWIGAIGCYALWLGKPLIANDERPVKAAIWPADNPIFSAASADEINLQLERLLSNELREEISRKSKDFAEKYLGPERLLFSLIEEC